MRKQATVADWLTSLSDFFWLKAFVYTFERADWLPSPLGFRLVHSVTQSMQEAQPISDEPECKVFRRVKAVHPASIKSTHEIGS